MFKIENGIPAPTRTSKEDAEKLRATISTMTSGQSVFVEHTLISQSAINEVLKKLRETATDRKYVTKSQAKPIKGVRIWVKFFSNE